MPLFLKEGHLNIIFNCSDFKYLIVTCINVTHFTMQCPVMLPSASHLYKPGQCPQLMPLKSELLLIHLSVSFVEICHLMTFLQTFSLPISLPISTSSP